MKKVIMVLALSVLLGSVIAHKVSDAPMPRRSLSPIESALVKVASNENVDPVILASICYYESKFKPMAIHENDGGSGSYGLCQIKLALAKSLGYKGSVNGLLDPTTNATFAAKALRYHMKKTHGIEELIAAYNAGRVNRRNGVIRNITYVRNVQSNAKMFVGL